MTDKDRLSNEGYHVADDYRNGVWHELAGKPPKDVWRFLVEEIRRRCPGFKDKEYDDALEQGFVDSR